jgi:uncharacterized membrane protein (DUF2068 family)
MRWLQSLSDRTPEHDRFVRLIILERIIKAGVLIGVAVTLVVGARTGVLYDLAHYAQDQLLLAADRSFITQLLFKALEWIGFFPHQTLLAVGLVGYALLEGTEGVGLAMRRRWAEYLTVVATGMLIPYEVYELVHHPTLFKAGALLLNVAVVAYLAWKKRLFRDL